jgi:hypothetical protein
MAHKKTLKCRVRRHTPKPGPGKPQAAHKAARVNAKLRSKVKHRVRKPRSAKNKKHEKQQKAAGNTPQQKCQAAAAPPQAAAKVGP